MHIYLITKSQKAAGHPYDLIKSNNISKCIQFSLTFISINLQKNGIQATMQGRELKIKILLFCFITITFPCFYKAQFMSAKRHIYNLGFL